MNTSKPSIHLRAVEPEDLDLLYKIENDVKLWKSDATVVDEVVFRHYLAQESMKDDFRALDEEISTEDYVIAFKKENVELYSHIPKTSASIESIKDLYSEATNSESSIEIVVLSVLPIAK